MVICGENSIISNIILIIKEKFKISNCEKINYILGIKIVQENFTYTISQENYVKNLLQNLIC